MAGKKPGGKNTFLYCKSENKEQAYCHAGLNNETSLMLYDGMRDEVSGEMCERGANQGEFFAWNARTRSLPARENLWPAEPLTTVCSFHLLQET